MKKLLAIFMLFLLLGTSSNLKSSLHFCGDVLTQFGFGEHEIEPCDCADMSSMDCCEDVIIKTQNSAPAVLSSFQFKHFSAELLVFTISNQLEPLNDFDQNPICFFKNQSFRKRGETELSRLSVFRI
jgi:hypothetical protein